MAIADPLLAGSPLHGPGSAGASMPGSCQGVWVTANTDARTQISTFDPGAITAETFRWVQVPNGTTRLLLRGKTPQGTTATGTSPVVKIIGVFGPLTDGAPADGVPVMRLDNADANATGITVTLGGDGTTVLSDATWDYGNPTTLDGYDHKGASYVGLLVITAASITADAAVPLEIMFLN